MRLSIFGNMGGQEVVEKSARGSARNAKKNRLLDKNKKGSAARRDSRAWEGHQDIKPAGAKKSLCQEGGGSKKD